MDTSNERIAAPGTISGAAAAPAKPRSKRGPLLVVAAIAAAAGGAYYLHQRHFEETDDAQIDGNISSVGARVAGTVATVSVREGQEVKTGALLLELDTADLAVLVEQAKAQVAQAEAQLKAEDPSVDMAATSNTAAVSSAQSDIASASAGMSAARQEVNQLQAQLEQARAADRQAQLDRERDEALLATHSISQAEYDRAVNAAAASAAGAKALEQSLAAAKDRVAEAGARAVQAHTRFTEVRSNAPRELDTRRASVLVRQAALEMARVNLRQAELNLSYTRILAPVDGIVSKKAVAVGDRIAAGQVLFAISQTGQLWVTANFRETQLRAIRLDQRVTVHVDATGADLTGAVDAIGGATGSRLSLFPPENASGNFVKVVQRVPVRIRLDPNQAGMEQLRPGMSVEPEVYVR
jgi:membrane fusion protein (multidrug efflux system)